MQHISLRPSPSFMCRFAYAIMNQKCNTLVWGSLPLLCLVSDGGGSQGGLKAAAQQQLALSTQDSMMQAKEREEMSELQDEVKKLREKAQVQILVFF